MTPSIARILPCSLAPAGERDLRLAGDELERRSHSLIVTRYFLRILSPNASEQMTDAQTRAWFAKRERIFNRYTLPSVVAQTKQNKSWLVFIEKSLVELLPKTLADGRGRPSSKLSKSIPLGSTSSRSGTIIAGGSTDEGCGRSSSPFLEIAQSRSPSQDDAEQVSP